MLGEDRKLTGIGPPITSVQLQRMKTLRMNICKKCQKEFKINDSVFSKRAGGSRTNVIYYHQKCWEEMQY